MALPAQILHSVGGTGFGPGDQEPSGKTFSARVFVDGRRYRELDRREQYFACTQHDSKRFDFDGRIIQATSGIGFTQPLLTSERAAWLVPLRARRPSAPYRLAKAIVNAFTNHVFGEGRFPVLSVSGDEDSDDWVKTCAKVGQLPMRMVRVRNIGGSVGTVGLSWAFIDGKPRYNAHNGKHLFVHEWEDRDALVPAHVTECFLFSQEEYDPVRDRVVENFYWQRKDWTKQAEIVFLPALMDANKEPEWIPDVDKSVRHGDNDTHFVWVQNLPSDQIDGLPDYDGLYESLDEIDTLLSVIVRGAKLNLDPTLVIKEDKLFVQRFGIKKGSDNALVVDKEGGDAKYLELAGSSIEAGLKLFNEHRRTILEVAECVIPDPDQVAASGQSSVAMKMIFTRMMSKGGILQEQYGEGLRRLMEPVLFISQQRTQVPVQVLNEETGGLEDVQQAFQLPPRIDQKDVLGDDGMPTGHQQPVVNERQPGEGEDVEVEWPPRFPPTALDQQQAVTTLSTAVGAKPILSQQTAVEIVTELFGKEPADEWAKVQKDAKDQDAKEQQMQAGGAGGQVGAPGQLPPGAKPKPPGGGGAPKTGGGGGVDKEEKPAEPPAD